MMRTDFPDFSLYTANMENTDTARNSTKKMGSNGLILSVLKKLDIFNLLRYPWLSL